MPEQWIKARVPAPPHPYQRREPLPWQRPKPVEEDPEAQKQIKAIVDGCAWGALNQ